MNNREIKFRAYTFDDNMIYDVIPNGRTILKPLEVKGSDVGEYELVDVKAITQYTGLTDKDGNEIYEGDIVKGKRYQGESADVVEGEVFFEDCSYFVGTADVLLGGMGELEIIGNKFENSDLL